MNFFAYRSIPTHLRHGRLAKFAADKYSDSPIIETEANEACMGISTPLTDADIVLGRYFRSFYSAVLLLSQLQNHLENCVLWIRRDPYFDDRCGLAVSPDLSNSSPSST